MNWLTYRTTSATEKICSAVVPSCFNSPFTHNFNESA